MDGRGPPGKVEDGWGLFKTAGDGGRRPEMVGDRRELWGMARVMSHDENRISVIWRCLISTWIVPEVQALEL